MYARAFLGTGLLGTGMAEGALGRGDTVSVWNRTLERAAGLAQHGATLAPTPAEAVVGADVVHLVLTNDAAVDGVLAQLETSLTDLVRRGVPLLDHSTTSPAGTAARAAQLWERGVTYLHAPVFMSPNAARAAQGTVIVAGPRAGFDAHEAKLAPMCAMLRHVGERADLAAIMKLIGNAMNLSMLNGLADILTMARGLDVTPEQALAVFGIIDVRFVIDGRGRAMAAGQYDPLWTVDVARKDVALMLGCAPGESFGALAAVDHALDALQQAGAGELDVAVLGRRHPSMG
ncbi:MAG: NAD(P)-dependent oxidoreductase [Sandaracinaceae bacterium]|jgi:3-hydroxyisobutyrate dehydrogenase|nr:NAD(P)-dependent oxidoreductase [Sandaracinaceae bacterium]MBP7681565.1 NAD(P)-dependent oxidoreductase [Deltaproteobacteria bacterium]MBK6808709.1 NAD(P)-dependent oxidoreductase [Sandaracinaceae bacterium]MBK7150279.1 NAD(P)-dependent oxidoreductase [Sandaracinaceae bacterium]MBK7774345.1 NAD(P)-dependent oxidoreductase [Sandaracinaceae bacterium]